MNDSPPDYGGEDEDRQDCLEALQGDLAKDKALAESQRTYDCIIADLAKFMHDEYEANARLTGWTNDQFIVPFSNIPPKKQMTWLKVAAAVYKRIGGA
jgi:hypothetical protein